MTLSGGYNNSAIISTYRASILSANLRLSQRLTKPSTLIYSYSYRRVSVNSNTLQVSLSEIPLAGSAGARGGSRAHVYPRYAATYRWTRIIGTLNTGEVFLADGKFGSQANFERGSTSAIPRITTLAGTIG